jgi:2',3'-cyclic-nucleotide 2'-phosphodiesterase (5'-nucleotidase family)
MRIAGLLALGVAAVACTPTRSSNTATKAPVAHERKVTFLHIADTHAQLETHPEYLPGSAGFPMMGGYARIRSAMDRYRASSSGPTFTMDGGDTFQGSGPAAWSRGEAVVAPLNALDLDVCVPGNWEVVYGAPRFRELMNELSCRVSAYNFHDTKSGARLFAPSVIIERDGVRVAFVGITDPTTTTRQPPATVVGLDSTRLDGLRDHVRALRGSADLVVAVTHTGLSISRQLAREIPEFDVVFSGHTHERTERPILEGKVIVVEPGSMGSFLGKLELTLGEDKRITGHAFQLVPIDAAKFPEDPKVKAVVDAALLPHRARMNEVVGRTETPLLRYDVLETTADDFIADAVRETARVDIGMSNGFRFAPPIPAGPITEGDLWSLLPLDTRIKAGTTTGKALRAYFENELELVFSNDPWKLSGGWGPRLSGLSMTFAAKAKPGERVRELRLASGPFVDSGTYSIAGCEREGEPLDVVCRMRGVKEVKALPMTIHEALRAYLHKHPVIAPKREARAVAVDLPKAVFSQDAILSNDTSTATGE